MRRLISTVWVAQLLLGFIAAPLMAQQPNDTLKPGDALRIRIFSEPTLNGEYPINEEGNIILPILGARNIVTWSIDSIRPRLAREYAQILRDPVIEVTPLRRILISGSVVHPGVYSVDATMGVREALALGGGTKSPQVRRVDLIRNGSSVWLALADTTGLNSVQLRSGDHLIVPANGWFSRNRWIWAPIYAAAITTAAWFIRRHNE